MGLLDLFSSENVTVIAYSNPECTSKVGEMELQINPDNITHDHTSTRFKNKFDSHEIEGSPGNEPKFRGIEPEIVRFDFFIDGTSLISGIGGLFDSYDDVGEFVDDFKELTYKYNGKIHGPNYLKLVWGELFNDDNRIFKCRLTRLDINYTLFRSDGTPLRARLDCTFEQYLTEDEIKKIANKSSPDLSHIRIVQGGDSLPLLCHEIYGSSAYYLQVAKINGLTNIHQIKPGQRLHFPPLAK